MWTVRYYLRQLPKAKIRRLATRRQYGSPGAGRAARFRNRHHKVIDYVFDASREYFIRTKKK